MANTWNFDSLTYDSEDKVVLDFTGPIFNKKMPGTSEALTKGLNLYRFLLRHMNTPAKTLSKEITVDGNPMFTEKDIDAMRKTLKDHLDTPYAKHVLAQSAGAMPSTPTMPAMPAVPSAPTMPAMPAMPSAPTLPGLPSQPFVSAMPRVPTTAPGHGLDADPSRSKFWDKMIRKLIFPLTKQIPSCLDPILQWYFILYSLEQHPQYGVLISTFLDTVTLGLPVLADFVVALVGKFGGTVLGVAPGGGSAANIAAMVIMALFVVVGVTLNVSRKHFGSAFILSFDAIPFVGDAISEGAQKIEIGAERYLQNRARLLGKLQSTMPKLAAFAEYWTPTPDIVEGPSPPISLNIIKDEAGDAFEATTGVDIEEAIADPIGALDAAAAPILAPIEAATGINVDKVLRDPTRITESIPSVPTAESLAASVKVPELPTVPTAESLAASVKVPELPTVPTAESLTTSVKVPELPTLPTTESLATSVKAPDLPTVSSATSAITKPNGPASFAPTLIRKRGGRSTRRSKPSGQRSTKKLRYGRR